MKNKLLNFFKNLFGQKVSKGEPKSFTVKVEEKKVINSVQMKGRTMAFRKQQLPRKVFYSSNGAKIRITGRLGEHMGKLKYKIEAI